MENKPNSFLDDRTDINIKLMPKPISINVYRDLYNSVGEHLNWLDRIFMKDDILLSKINHHKTFIYLFSVEDNNIGYCELVEDNNIIEILYFGLIPDFVGKGYGKYLLNKVIQLAWSHNPQHIQLNTCDLDHPNALTTYIKAGFMPYDEIIETKKVIAKE